MFPQALVQNTIIIDSDSFNKELLASILNANYFHIDKLVEESQKYRNLLRPWVEIHDNFNSIKLHQYYAALAPVTDNPRPVHIGDWVGRVRNTTSDSSKVLQQDCLILTSSISYYIYDEEERKLIPNSTPGLPCIVRPTVWGMVNPKIVGLKDISLIGNHYEYTCNSSDIQFKGTSDTPIDLAYTRDGVMARIVYTLDEVKYLIARVPVTIQRKWVPSKIAYEFALQFPDLNFPPDAEVEFW